MTTESEALSAAREALAALDEPMCGKPCKVYNQGHMWPHSARCTLRPGHGGRHDGDDRIEPGADHLRTALAEVDRLRNVLLVERGDGVPPSPEWQWDHSTAWILRREDNWHACVEFRSNGWTVSLRSEFWNVRSNHATAYEAMEAANAALGSK